MLVGLYMTVVRAHYARMHPHSPLRGAVAGAQRGANMLGLVLGAVVGLLVFAIVVWLFRT
jgi:hypothetical protein